MSGAVPCLSKDLTTTPSHPSNRLCKWEGATLCADRALDEGAKRKWERCAAEHNGSAHRCGNVPRTSLRWQQQRHKSGQQRRYRHFVAARTMSDGAVAS